MKTEKQLLDERLLWQSAEHWLENWRDPERASTDVDQCACCREYLHKSCLGCPISERTWRIRCRGTPYGDATVALHNIPFALGTMREFQEQAEKMYILLVELALSWNSCGVFNPPPVGLIRNKSK